MEDAEEVPEHESILLCLLARKQWAAMRIARAVFAGPGTTLGRAGPGLRRDTTGTPFSTVHLKRNEDATICT